MPKKIPNVIGGYFQKQDPAFLVSCECGEPLWVTMDDVERCPECKRGYKIELIVWEYEQGEEEKSRGKKT